LVTSVSTLCTGFEARSNAISWIYKSNKFDPFTSQNSLNDLVTDRTHAALSPRRDPHSSQRGDRSLSSRWRPTSCTRTHTYARTHTHARARAHTHTHACTRTCTHTRKHGRHRIQSEKLVVAEEFILNLLALEENRRGRKSRQGRIGGFSPTTRRLPASVPSKCFTAYENIARVACVCVCVRVCACVYVRVCVCRCAGDTNNSNEVSELMVS
jgi:hypothetical protein